MEKVVVELCLGSSCFARGNSLNLQALEAYLQEESLADRVELVGHLCLGNCAKGPNLRIGGQPYSSLDSNQVIDEVKKQLQQQKADV